MKSTFYSDTALRNNLFIGTVEDNKDPTFNYRIKVRISELHPTTITTEQLPWAARVDTAFMGVQEGNDLCHRIPEVGTKVLVLAVGNDLNSLLYIGILHKKTSLTPTNDSYLNTYGVYRYDGQFIGIDKIQKLFQMLFDGDVNIDKIHNMTIRASNSINIECQIANIKAANSVNIDTPTTNISGNVNISGNTNVTGNVISQAEVSAKGGAVNLSTHTHPYEMGGTAAGTANTQPGNG